jgi:hypothetical protein
MQEVLINASCIAVHQETDGTILVIHPNRDPDFSDPDFRDPDFSNSHTLLTWSGERRKFYYSH